MPEPRIIPAGRTLTPLALPPGALEDIQLRARRRRAGRAAATGSAALTVAVLVAVSALASGLEQRDDSLQIGPATRGGVVPAPVVTPPAETAVVDAEPPAERAAAAAGAAAAAPKASRQAPPAVVAAPAAAAPAVVEPPAERAPDRRRFDPDAVQGTDSVLVVPPECEQIGSGAVDGWCLRAWGDEERLLLSACRARGYGSGRLEWVTSQRVRFEVRDPSGEVVWSYDPRVRPQPGSEQVAGEQCISWTALWGATNEQGQRLDPGTYGLHAASTATSLRAVWERSTIEVDPRPEGAAVPAEACSTQSRVPSLPRTC